MFKIKIPATTANLGSGFDCFGLAIKLYNTFKFEETADGFECVMNFKSKKDHININENENLVYTTVKKVFNQYGKRLPGIYLEEDISIPFSRGLGSSASAVLAGILASNIFLGDIMKEEDILNLAFKIEGHGDNIVPALKGGFNITVLEDNRIVYKKLEVDENLKIVVLVPKMQIRTKDSRKILPSEVKMEDAVFNIARASLLTACFTTKDYKYFPIAFQDKLHQNYRAKLIPGFDKVIINAYKNGALGVALSGSGSSIIAFCEKNEKYVGEEMVKTLFSYGLESEYLITFADNQGALII